MEEQKSHLAYGWNHASGCPHTHRCVILQQATRHTAGIWYRAYQNITVTASTEFNNTGFKDATDEATGMVCDFINPHGQSDLGGGVIAIPALSGFVICTPVPVQAVVTAVHTVVHPHPLFNITHAHGDEEIP